VLLLLHVPPDTVFVRLVVCPAHTEVVPPIAEGNGLTVKPVVVKHPVGKVYVITVVPPGLAPPAAIPELLPMDATVVLLLLHVPPPDGSPNVVVRLTQMFVLPVIADGKGLTVTIAVVEHPPAV